MTKTIMTEMEAIQILIDEGVSSGEEMETAFYKKKGYINSDASLDTFIEKLEQVYESVSLVINPKSKAGRPYAGKKRLYELGARRDEVAERVTGNATNGYKRTDNEKLLKELFYKKLLEEKDQLDKHRSYNGWATFLGIATIDMDEDKAVEYLEEYYGYQSNEWFKPLEIVNEFQKAHINYRKSVVRGAFDSLAKDEKVKLESFYVSGTPEENDFHRINFKEITHEEYEEMRALREQVVESNGSNLNEYFSFINKKKTEKMKKVFRAVEDALVEAYEVTRFHESIKVTLCNPEDEPEEVYGNIEHLFSKHMVERSITYRHNRDSYKVSTYFWQRFYIMNTFKLMEFMGNDGAIDKVLLSDEEREFKTNLKSYLYDFDTSTYMVGLIEAEGFFGDVKAEAVKRHKSRMKSLEIGLYDAKQAKIEDMLSQLPLDMLFDPGTDTAKKEEKEENHDMTKSYEKYENADEWEWMVKADKDGRYTKNRKEREAMQTPVKPTITVEEMKTNPNMIDLTKLGLKDEYYVKPKRVKIRNFASVRFDIMPERKPLPYFEHVEIPEEIQAEWNRQDEVEMMATN